MPILPQKKIEQQTADRSGSILNVAYQALYATIALSWKPAQKQYHTVVMTTPASYQESSQVAASTAIAAAQSGTFTILVDADLQTPTLHRHFNVNMLGLSDLSTSEKITPQTLTAYFNQTSFPNLQVLSAGQKQLTREETGRFFATRATDLVNSLSLHLESAEARSGLILFSGPPVLSGIDTLLLSAQVEQTFLVIVTGRTTRTQARKARDLLQKAHANLEGMVLLEI